MEVRLMLLCSVTLLSLSTVICDDNNSNKVIEFANSEYEPSSNQFNYTHTLYLSRTNTNTYKVKDTESPRTSANDRFAKKFIESKLNSLMRNNSRMEEMLFTLNAKVDLILKRLQKEARNDSLMERLEVSNSVKEIVEKIDEHTIQVQKLYTASNGISNENSNVVSCNPDCNYTTNPKVANITTHQNPKQDKNNDITVFNVKYNSFNYQFHVTVIYENSMNACHNLQRSQHNIIYKFTSLDNYTNEAGRPFNERYCEFATNDYVAWTVIQRREWNEENEENFHRSWLYYKLGFGDLDKEFWFGNEFLNKLTSDEDFELRTVFKNKSGHEEWAQYSFFKVEPEQCNYNVIIGSYYGSTKETFLNGYVQDSGQNFGQNNNNLPCTSPDVNDRSDVYDRDIIVQIGIDWKKWVARQLLQSSKMMIRPKVLRNQSEEHNMDIRFSSGF